MAEKALYANLYQHEAEKIIPTTGYVKPKKKVVPPTVIEIGHTYRFKTNITKEMLKNIYDRCGQEDGDIWPGVGGIEGLEYEYPYDDLGNATDITLSGDILYVVEGQPTQDPPVLGKWAYYHDGEADVLPIAPALTFTQELADALDEEGSSIQDWLPLFAEEVLPDVNIVPGMKLRLRDDLTDGDLFQIAGALDAVAGNFYSGPACGGYFFAGDDDLEDNQLGVNFYNCEDGLENDIRYSTVHGWYDYYYDVDYKKIDPVIVIPADLDDEFDFNRLKPFVVEVVK